MKNLIQYHRPERMGCGVDEIGGPPFSILTSVANGNPIGDRVWLVGRTSDLSSDVFISYCFIVDDVVAANHPVFLYRYVGETGTEFDEMPKISDAAWYPKLLKMTGNFNFGLTTITQDEIVSGLVEAADKEGYKVG